LWELNRENKNNGANEPLDPPPPAPHTPYTLTHTYTTPSPPPYHHPLPHHHRGLTAPAAHPPAGTHIIHTHARKHGRTASTTASHATCKRTDGHLREIQRCTVRVSYSPAGLLHEDDPGGVVPDALRVPSPGKSKARRGGAIHQGPWRARVGAPSHAAGKQRGPSTLQPPPVHIPLQPHTPRTPAHPHI
jgi:hypothetical protein